MRARAVFFLGASLAVVASACAPDGPDVYSVVDAPPATRAPIATTTTTTTMPVVADDAAAAPEPEPVVTEPAVTQPTSFAPNGVVVDVRSLDNTFIQQVIEIEAGTEVNWINGGRNDHNVLPVDTSLDWGVDRDTFVPGTEYSHVFDEPGVFPYYCSIHGTQDVGMIGTVIVVAPA